MKKITAALLLSAVVATPAFAGDAGWYIGVDAGSASQGNIGGANVTYTNNRNTVGGVQLGYQLDKNWGVELFFTGAGKQRVSTIAAPTTTYADIKADVWGLDAVGTLPLSDAFSVYAKLGIASSKTTVTPTTAFAAASTLTGDSRTAATYGVGLQYNATPAVGVRFAVDSYGLATKNGTVAGSTDKMNSTVTSLGVVFKF